MLRFFEKCFWVGCIVLSIIFLIGCVIEGGDYGRHYSLIYHFNIKGAIVGFLFGFLIDVLILGYAAHVISIKNSLDRIERKLCYKEENTSV